LCEILDIFAYDYFFHISNKEIFPYFKSKIHFISHMHCKSLQWNYSGIADFALTIAEKIGNPT